MEQSEGFPPLTDSHAHLDHVAERLGQQAVETLLDSYEQAWENAFPAGEASAADTSLLPFIVDIGTMPGDLADRYKRYGMRRSVRFSAGLWPGEEVFLQPAAALAALEQDIRSGYCAALGECGLDYHHMFAEPERQKALFRSQAVLAAEAGLPLVVHSRDAWMDTLAVVAELSGAVNVILHCFGYGVREAEKFIEAGCFLSFAGNISYRKSEALREALKIVPGDRFLLETDSPYMNPMPQRGKPSTSGDIVRTLDCAAEIRGCSSADLAGICQANAFRIFS